ncbi:hypothetical protein MMC07_008660, partial [Pseudocyphellaria aurata]|nr:hypothetical protein [Pseudocyphellaria aurata]
MSDSAVTIALNKASEITKLNGLDDWMEWNRKLRGHLGMVDLWATLTGDVPQPTSETPERTLWENHQRKLASLLLLICGPSALSLVELKGEESATAQYLFLKSTYNTITITAYSTQYRQIHRCSIANHKSIKEYGEEVTNARNKLKELRRPVDELQVTCAFLDGLDPSYQSWKDTVLEGYAENPTCTVQGVTTMLVPTVEEVLKLLIDRESSTPSLSQKAASRAFGAKDRSKEKDKDTNKD